MLEILILSAAELCCGLKLPFPFSPSSLNNESEVLTLQDTARFTMSGSPKTQQFLNVWVCDCSAWPRMRTIIWFLAYFQWYAKIWWIKGFSEAKTNIRIYSFFASSLQWIFVVIAILSIHLQKINMLLKQLFLIMRCLKITAGWCTAFALLIYNSAFGWILAEFTE